ncbi:MAG: DUF72 domain-containing protein [Deltaproteobacteria bacterium]|nr:DUF72 domain-containing protein [Deltaproteobacteria bacterium]
MDPRLQILLKNRCYFGTSSWKYPGWKGLVYQKPYGNEKEFKDSCLKEYAEHYPCVGVDHTYYSWPTAKGFATYTEQTPEHFRFILKATEKVTIFKYPALPRYAKEAGKLNDTFLNAELFQEKFLKPLLPYQDRIGPIMFEFSQFHQGTLSRGSEFVERLNNFLKEITKNTAFKFAVEIRNSNWLQPAYFECLVNHQVGHVFNSWSRMPLLGDQFDKAKSYSLPFFIGRLLLQPGILYQEAVDSFAPYDKLHQELTPIRDSVVKLLLLAQTRNIDSYILVNNRFEGCAPKTIEGILKGLPTTDLKGQ